MNQRIINPWKWQESLGFSHAVEVSGYTHTLYCAGQTSTDENGRTIEGDMAAQMKNSFDQLEVVLKQSGYSLKNVVRLNFYTTSIEAFFGAYDKAVERMKEAGCFPSSTLLEVKALASPQLLLEIEATAVK